MVEVTKSLPNLIKYQPFGFTSLDQVTINSDEKNFVRIIDNNIVGNKKTSSKQEENIVGLKEATGNMAQASQTMYLTDGKIDMYSGEDGLVLPMLSIGSIGVISVWSNIAPRQVHDLCYSYFNGDMETAQKLQREALPLVDALFSDVNPIPVKTAMNLMGMEVGPLRAPLCDMSDAAKAKLIEAMKNYGLKLV